MKNQILSFSRLCLAFNFVLLVIFPLFTVLLRTKLYLHIYADLQTYMYLVIQTHAADILFTCPLLSIYSCALLSALCCSLSPPRTISLYTLYDHLEFIDMVLVDEFGEAL